MLLALWPLVDEVATTARAPAAVGELDVDAPAAFVAVSPSASAELTVEAVS